MKRRICVVTGTRSEYGLLKPLIDELRRSRSVDLKLVATGMHLSPEFGLTYKEIEEDGITIDEKVETLLSSDTPVGVSKAVGLGIISFSETFRRLDPELVVGLGDRFELFAAVVAAMIAGIPVAHLHGGELTKGAIDDAIRHSITKMSQLHFTAAQEYRKRVIQLGEDPDRVFNVGAIGLDNIRNMKLLSRGRLERELGLKITPPTLLVTFHPATLDRRTAGSQFKELLGAFDEMKELNLIFTMPNADHEAREIMHMIERFVGANKKRARAFVSLGRLKYLSAVKWADGVVGNSSSGIIEVPGFRKGTVNIGDRQEGRIIPASVINCPPDRRRIVESIRLLLSDEFRERLRDVVNPHGDGRAAGRIAAILISYPLDGIVKKGFHSLGVKK